MNSNRQKYIGPGLFDERDSQVGQQELADAEHLLLKIADYVYAHTSLKPISKTLFLISRCLFVAKLSGGAANATELRDKYRQIRSSLNGAAPGDDFDFSTVVAECEQHIPRVLDTVSKVCRLTADADSLGLVFNTLLRGKFEGGEGMGTFLTPEEVVFPMVDMLLEVVGSDALQRLNESELLFGDICGGTGRFVDAIARRMESRGVPRRAIEKAARLFDQSLMAVDMGRLNFLFAGMQPSFDRVGDSLVAPEVGALTSRFLLLATNPPFGSNKYRWSKQMAECAPSEVLAAIGLRGSGDTADPSELFFFRNLDLLAPGGALAIVLPDGVVQSEDFKGAILAYERARNTRVNVAALVSLPPVTFALGGTVAKTSFLVVQKQLEPEDKPMYIAMAANVGFVKRGKTRANDPKGNDLLTIADEFCKKKAASLGRIAACWREYESLVPARLLHAMENNSSPKTRTRLSDLVDLARDFQRSSRGNAANHFHVSVLDVDETGLIDIVAASKNSPLSKGLDCRNGDILLSCMNPKIWRVAVIPNMVGSWSCSPEFVVLRPKRGRDAWKVAMALHHPSVMLAVQAMAKGTSSSRQRVPRQSVLSVAVPDIEASAVLSEYVGWREDFYNKRLLEARAYEDIHVGSKQFNWYAPHSSSADCSEPGSSSPHLPFCITPGS